MAKEDIIKMKSEPTVWENIFANDTSDRVLIFKIYKELTRLNGKYTEGSETYEEMLSTTSHQRDANYNHNEVPLHSSQNGQHKQINKQVLGRLWRKGNPSALLVGM